MITGKSILMNISSHTVVVVYINTKPVECRSKRKRPAKAGRFLIQLDLCPRHEFANSPTGLRRSNCLDLADVEGVWAFWAVADLKRDLVSFLEFIERNVLELVGMEEKILCLAIAFDEAEAFLVLLDDYSFLHTEDR